MSKDTPQPLSKAATIEMAESTDHFHTKDALKTDYQRVDPKVARYASEAAVHIDNATNSCLKRMIDKRVLVVLMVTYFRKQSTNWLFLLRQSWACAKTRIHKGHDIVSDNYRVHCGLGGRVLSLHAACHNFAGFVTVRFFLGSLEAVCQPTFVLLTGICYVRSEQASRAV
jgi:hypothetical protein